MTREEARQLLYEFTATETLRRHAFAVEAAMRAYAGRLGGDVEEWGVVGLLHDFDYERFPQYPDHPMKGSEILKTRGMSEELRRVILSHVPATNVPRESPMAKALFASDELCGFIMACAAVRPNKLADLTAASVRKKLKDKAFARAVSREDIQRGMDELGVGFDDHVQFVIDALKGIAPELGLSADVKGES